LIITDIVVLKEVLIDLDDGRRFYDHIHKGAGDYFWDSLIAEIESLIIYAGVHRKQSEYYRMLANRFPYAVYYEIDGNIVRVVAVLPMRRKPLWINKQLGKR
jgi:hypothetical protein